MTTIAERPIYIYGRKRAERARIGTGKRAHLVAVSWLELLPRHPTYRVTAACGRKGQVTAHPYSADLCQDCKQAIRA